MLFVFLFLLSGFSVGPSPADKLNRDIDLIKSLEKQKPLLINQLADAGLASGHFFIKNASAQMPEGLVSTWWETVAQVLFNAGEQQLFLDVFLKLHQQYPSKEFLQSPLNYERLCWFLRLTPQKNECEAWLRRAEKISSPQLKTLVVVERARDLQARGHPLKSRQLLLPLVELTRGDRWMEPWVHFHIAETYMAQHQWEKARRSLLKTEKLLSQEDRLLPWEKCLHEIASIVIFRNEGFPEKALNAGERLRIRLLKQVQGEALETLLWLNTELFASAVLAKRTASQNEYAAALEKQLNRSPSQNIQKSIARVVLQAAKNPRAPNPYLNEVHLAFGPQNPRYLDLVTLVEKFKHK